MGRQYQRTKDEKIEVEENECIDEGALTQDSGLDSVARVPRSGFISLLGWLTKDRIQWWPTVN